MTLIVAREKSAPHNTSSQPTKPPFLPKSSALGKLDQSFFTGSVPTGSWFSPPQAPDFASTAQKLETSASSFKGFGLPGKSAFGSPTPTKTPSSSIFNYQTQPKSSTTKPFNFSDSPFPSTTAPVGPPVFATSTTQLTSEKKDNTNGSVPPVSYLELPPDFANTHKFTTGTVVISKWPEMGRWLDYNKSKGTAHTEYSPTENVEMYGGNREKSFLQSISCLPSYLHFSHEVCLR